MAQLLANELLIMTFKELLNETSFKYMISICTVCKKWNELIKLAIIEGIESRSKNELSIKFESIKNCPIINMNCSDSTCNIFVNVDLYYPIVSINNLERKALHTGIKYKHKESYPVEFSLGTLFFYRIQKSKKVFETKYKINWSHKDRKCIFTVSEQKFGYPPGIVVKVEKLILPLKKICAILDLLDEG